LAYNDFNEAFDSEGKGN